VALVDHCHAHKVKIAIDIIGENSFASRVNFYKLLGFDFKEGYIRRKSIGRFIEIKKFNQDGIYQLQEEINMILYQVKSISKEVLQLLFYCLNEIMDNVINHANIGSGWVSAQYFPLLKEIRLIICDNGIGIHAALTKNPLSKYKHLSEIESLKECIERGVTNGKGLGFGLFATAQFILKNKGHLLIYSGNYHLMNKTDTYEVSKGDFWQGTLIQLRIKTNNVVNYKDIMPVHHTLPDDYNFFVEKYFGDDNELW
jgi:anti-sigma regulatory factor (Ser/Thr protein kinase)